MVRKLSLLAAWGLLAFITYATFSPLQHRPTISHSTHVEHLGAYLLLGVLFRIGYPRNLLLACLVVIGGAILLELMQHFTPDRHARLLDGAAKAAGSAVGIAVAEAALYLAARINRRPG